ARPSPEAPPVTSATLFSSQPISEKIAQVARQQHRLLEENLAVRDLKGSFHPPQHVAARSDPRILFGIEPRAIKMEIRFHFELAAAVANDSHVGDQVTRARRRILRPRPSTLELRDAPGEQGLGVAEKRHLARLREFLVRLALHPRAPNRHEVIRILREQPEPLVVSMRVEKSRLVIVEALDLVLPDHRRNTLLARTQTSFGGHLCISLDELTRRGRLPQLVPTQTLHPLRP